VIPALSRNPAEMHEILVPLASVWGPGTLTFTATEAREPIPSMPFPGIRDELLANVRDALQMSETVEPAKWLAREERASKSSVEDARLQRDTEALVTAGRNRFRRLLDQGRWVLDDPAMPLEQKKPIYDALVNLRILDRVAALRRVPKELWLRADRALGTLFAVGKESGLTDLKIDEVLGRSATPRTTNIAVQGDKATLDASGRIQTEVDFVGKVFDRGGALLIADRVVSVPEITRPIPTRDPVGLALDLEGVDPSTLIWVEIAGWKLLFHRGVVDTDRRRYYCHRIDPRLIASKKPSIVTSRQCLLPDARAVHVEFHEVLILAADPRLKLRRRFHK
jgi:hypothetical protein